MMELMTINKDCKLNKIKAGDNFHQFFFLLSRTPTHTHTHSLPVLLPVFSNHVLVRIYLYFFYA